ncbi:alpha-amylase family glycosyl hydrolase [Oleiharenicola sp. Vm1]|uniref:alpha-amylase family glycosyl hydrolase n=1 Tax=Oleiharenicola sp. Vm1 TaxID=3398393 RepID=UPI0039F5CA65
MPDRFANGDPSNDTGHLPGGPEQNGFDPTRIGYYHGGDFAGLTGKLDYIQGLNVSTIWTTPPYRNNPVQDGSAGYHGYWPIDFLNVDPHLGTNADYREFIRQTHARGLRVYLDIVVNHTGDIIKYRGGRFTYIDQTTAPYRDAQGRPFDARAVAYNGLNDPAAFPALSAERSFAYVPVVPPGLEHAKNPDWLNDVTLYHNRGNSTFQGESAVHGDFVGLDDPMNEHPRVVRGFIDIFSQWLDWGVDGFRIDTMRHVNTAFWQAFNPAIRARARALGRPDFLQFGEVMNEVGDVAYLSEFSTGSLPADSTTDFGFAAAARKFISQGGPAAALEDFFLRDDYYTDHDSNVHSSVTLLGNYDIGRWGYFLLQDNPGAPLDQIADLARLGHGLMYFARGMPTLHYGDEQGMLGAGGNDQQAREDMFPRRPPPTGTPGSSPPRAPAPTTSSTRPTRSTASSPSSENSAASTPPSAPAP